MELKVLQAERAKVKFDDAEDERLDRTMESLVREITEKMRKCEREVQSISQFDEDAPCRLDDKIRKNIQISFANRIRELAMELRRCERQQMKRMEKYGSEGPDDGNSNDLTDLSLDDH